MIDQLPLFYEFGPFSVNVGKRLLLRHGEPVSVAPKVLETLLVLIENRERVLSKDELLKQVWGDTIVEEGGLTRNVSVLRKALGEKPEDHHYIVTVPARGYRFVAEVRAGRDTCLSSDAHPLSVQEQERPWWRLSARRWLVLGAAVLGVTALTYALRPVRATDLRGPLPSVNAAAYDSVLRAKYLAMLLAESEPLKAQALIGRVAKRKAVNPPHHAAYSAASAWARMGHAQEAVESLREAAEAGFPCYPLFAHDTNLDPIRQNPRFHPFLADRQQQSDSLRKALFDAK